MSRFVIAVEVSADLDEIGDYFLDRSVEAGERWFQDFNQKYKYLAQFPSIWTNLSRHQGLFERCAIEWFYYFL